MVLFLLFASRIMGGHQKLWETRVTWKDVFCFTSLALPSLYLFWKFGKNAVCFPSKPIKWWLSLKDFASPPNEIHDKLQIKYQWAICAHPAMWPSFITLLFPAPIRAGTYHGAAAYYSLLSLRILTLTESFGLCGVTFSFSMPISSKGQESQLSLTSTSWTAFEVNFAIIS